MGRSFGTGLFNNAMKSFILFGLKILALYLTVVAGVTLIWGGSFDAAKWHNQSTLWNGVAVCLWLHIAISDFPWWKQK